MKEPVDRGCGYRNVVICSAVHSILPGHLHQQLARTPLFHDTVPARLGRTRLDLVPETPFSITDTSDPCVNDSDRSEAVDITF